MADSVAVVRVVDLDAVWSLRQAVMWPGKEIDFIKIDGDASPTTIHLVSTHRRPPRHCGRSLRFRGFPSTPALLAHE